MFWRKKENSRAASDETTCARALYRFLLGSIQDKRGVRVEDLISAAASIAGERCIEAAGDFPARTHTLVPGSRCFSTRVNELLGGDAGDGDITAVPANSVFGIVRDRLVPGKYVLADFPSLHEIFQLFAAKVGERDEWGKAPLSIPEEHRPFLLPLRVAYETRRKVDEILAPLGNDPAIRLRATTLTLAEALTAVADAIDHRLVLRLAFETVNGMAKTAPMTDVAMAESARRAAPFAKAPEGTS